MTRDDDERARARDVLVRTAHARGRLAVVYHADADGIASAALSIAAFERLGGSVVPLTPMKGESVYHERFQRDLEGGAPSARASG